MSAFSPLLFPIQLNSVSKGQQKEMAKMNKIISGKQNFACGLAKVWNPKSRFRGSNASLSLRSLKGQD